MQTVILLMSVNILLLSIAGIIQCKINKSFDHRLNFKNMELFVQENKIHKLTEYIKMFSEKHNLLIELIDENIGSLKKSVNYLLFKELDEELEKIWSTLVNENKPSQTTGPTSAKENKNKKSPR